MSKRIPLPRLVAWMLVLAAVAVCAGALARQPEPVAKIEPGVVLNGRTIVLAGANTLDTDLAKAAAETLDLYGGPGTLEGKFQTAEGLPDPQGWTPVDETVADMEAYWNISDYQAANLDPETPDNLAWWCGWEYPACVNDIEGGYGNDWYTWLRWTGQVTDPGQTATVTVTGVLNLDSEINYDFLYLLYETQGGDQVVFDLEGTLTGYQINESFTYQPGDFLGSPASEIAVKFLFDSDNGWSDEDCLYSSAGAAQIDNLQVTISQAGYPDLVSPVETCQPGDPVQWVPGSDEGGGCGNFGQLWTDLDDIDPDQDNHSPQWAFIDDGVIVPGVGPSLCNTWCYGPDGFVVNYTGGLCGDDGMVHNSVLSPPIAMPKQRIGSLVVSLDQYIHTEQESSILNLMVWGLESTADPIGAGGWVPFTDNFLFMDSGKYSRGCFVIDRQDLVPKAAFVRVRFGVIMFDDGWGPPDYDATPAPYFDNVRVQAVRATTGKPPKYDLADPGDPLEVVCSPNPFNPAVKISFTMPRAGKLSMRIYDLQGRLVDTLIDGAVAAGPGETTWHGTDQRGRTVAAGTYFCRIETAETQVVRKLQMVK